ncbi:MAG: hypothetical protein ACSHYB_10195 [Roseibacillus sp.]
MKVTDYHFLSLLLPAALSAQTVVPLDPNCCGNDPEGMVLEIRQAASAEVINARRSAAATNGYSSASVETEEEKVEIKIEKVSFLSGSEYLLGAKGFVIIPRGCAIIPGRGIQILAEAPADQKMQTWKEFQQANPATLRLLPITGEMLSGDEEALKSITQKIKTLKAGGLAYVTTLNGSPVSIPGLSTIES